MKFLIAVFVFTMSFGIFAEEINEEVNNEAISLEGQYKQPRRLTAADKMKKMRKRLEKQNELLVRKQIERIRVNQELELTRRIQKGFQQAMTNLEKVN